MSTTLLSLVELGLLVAGTFASLRLTRWLAREADRGVVLVAAVTVWVILFGVLPMLTFAIFAGQARSAGASIAAWESLVLNLIPFALVAAPFAGFVNGMRASKPRPQVK